MPDLDYEKMFKNMQEMLDKAFETQDEYFKLAREMNELAPYAEMLGKKFFEVKMSDQLKYFKIAVLLSRQAKLLCEKYGWDDEIETVEME